MRAILLACFLVASTCYAQQVALNLAQATSQNQNLAASSAQETIAVPSGTHIPVTLTSPITTKARKGDSVRAVVAFPVTVDSAVAIPVGVYLQGTIEKIAKRGRSGPDVQMQFTKMVYPNGYTVALEGNSAASGQGDAAVTSNTNSAPPANGVNGYAPRTSRAAATPMPPPLPPMPSHTGLIAGTLAAVAAVAVVGILVAHHSGAAGNGGVLYDTGWQFDVVLNSPLSLSTARIGSPATTQ